MKCSAIKVNCDRYLSKELEEFTFHITRKHLEKCPICRLYFREVLDFATLIKESLPPETVGSDFTDRVMEAICGERINVPKQALSTARYNQNQFFYFDNRMVPQDWQRGWTSWKPLRDIWFTIGNYSHDYYLKLSMNQLREEYDAG